MTLAPSRGRKPSLEKRDALISAALQLFATHGVEASTTREIAMIAGTTERTLFRHFASKNGLVQAAIEAVSNQFVGEASFARIHDPTPFTPEEFGAWHRAFLLERVASASHAPDSYRILLAELMRDGAFRDRFATGWTRMVFVPLTEHLARMQVQGAIASRLDPASLAGAFFSLNLGYLFGRFALAPGMAWHGERDIEAIVTLFGACCSS